MRGGRAAATAFSLAESCRLAGVDPVGYFADVLVRVGRTRRRPRASRPRGDGHQLTGRAVRTLFVTPGVTKSVLTGWSGGWGPQVDARGGPTAPRRRSARTNGEVAAKEEEGDVVVKERVGGLRVACIAPSVASSPTSLHDDREGVGETRGQVGGQRDGLHP